MARTVVLIGSYAPWLYSLRKDLISELIARDYHVVAVAPQMEPDIRDKLAALGCTPVSVDTQNRSSLNPFKDLLYFRELIRIFRAHKPTAVFCYTLKPVFLGLIAARVMGVSHRVAMFSGLGYAFTQGDEVKRRVLRVIVRVLLKISLSNCRSIIFQNRDDRDHFIAEVGVPAAVCSVVNGSGVDTAYYAEAPLPPTLSFLMISRFLKDKGLYEYLDAGVALRKTHPEAQVKLAGWLDNSPNSIKIEELDAYKAQGIEVLGRLEDVRPAIRESTVLVLPSYREGTPRTLLEGMAMGRPLIATDAPGCRETVVPDHNGYLVPVADTPALLAAMQAMADGGPDLRRRMGAASRALAQTKFESAAVARATADQAGLVS